MSCILHEHEIPVAYSMVSLAKQANEEDQPFQVYICYWAAFNNIYTTLADRAGKVPILVWRNNAVQFAPKWNYTFPKVKPVPEPEQIDEAIMCFSDGLKHDLITHASTRYFVYRTPKHVRSQHDAKGQLINGVLNLTRTTGPNYPVWSPIDKALYETYIAGNQNASDREILAQQIAYLLYTVRNNLVHGGKRADDATDCEVVVSALPLLKMVVLSFVGP